jgi:hypothetical protein
MEKDKVRVSFDIPIEEHIIYKTECVQSRINIKDFMHHLVVIGMKEYQKAKLKEKLERSIQQAKEGKTRTITSEELDKMFEDSDS